MDRSKALFVAVGGTLGATTRWTIATSTGAHAFPWTLLVVNIAGAFVLGLVAFRSATGPREPLRLGVGVGFCGGLTTFSAFAVEAADLLGDERTGTALVFVATSIAGAVLSVALGATVRHRLDPVDPLEHAS